MKKLKVYSVAVLFKFSFSCVCVCGISVPTLHCERKKVPGINSSISLWKSLPIVSIMFQEMLVQQP